MYENVFDIKLWKQLLVKIDPPYNMFLPLLYKFRNYKLAIKLHTRRLNKLYKKGHRLKAYEVVV